MDEDGLPIVGSGIDLTKVPAIQQKRTVAFLNQFVVHTVQFLNRFSTVCEEVCLLFPQLSLYTFKKIQEMGTTHLNIFDAVILKLSALSLRIQQIETTLNILDAKLMPYYLYCVTFEYVVDTEERNQQYLLSSIPGLEDVKFEVSSADVNSVTNGPVAQAATDQQTAGSPQSGQNNTQEEGLQKTEVVTENVTTVAKDPRYARYLKMVQVGVPVMAIRNKMISEGLNPDLLETPDAPVPAWGDDGKTEDSSDSESSFSD
ncbi:WASH complex subunit CCDC53 [Lonchura striata]|uniref:WASH complex subunit 3 n=1 Tax=Lonchura striata TaxID=40157 RepID=A0A218UXF6_9PASE|nr:WASH complex subunit CCDC53 [Lonchura striata domestica]